MPRKGQYLTSSLMRRFRPDQNMVGLLLILAADCPKIVASNAACVLWDGRSSVTLLPSAIGGKSRPAVAGLVGTHTGQSRGLFGKRDMSAALNWRIVSPALVAGAVGSSPTIDARGG